MNFINGYKYTHNSDFDKALSSFLKIKESDTVLKDYVLFYLAQSQRQSGYCQEALGSLHQLLSNFPESRWVALAKSQVQSANPCQWNANSQDQSPFGGQAVVGRFPAACRESVSKACPGVHIGDHPMEDSCEELKALPKKADCYFQSRRYAKAKEIYQTLTQQKKRSFKKDVSYLIKLSQSASRSQDFQTALWAHSILINRYPRSREAEESLKKMASIHQDAGQYSEAIQIYSKLVSQSKLIGEHPFYWDRMAWCYYRLKKYTEAIVAFDQSLTLREAPYTLYWKARSLEAVGERKKAQEIFQQLVIIYPETYYGLRAASRLYGSSHKYQRVLKSWWGGHPPLRIKNVSEKRLLPPDRGLQRIVALKDLHLLPEADVELRRFRSQTGIPLESYADGFEKKGDEFYFRQKGIAQEHEDFPVSYFSVIEVQKRRNQVPLDVWLIDAMIRQESHFREQVVSPVGAVGLLQVMPLTGKRVARENRWVDFDKKWLYEPITNIELAVLYLKKLCMILDSRWYAVVAAYNAGEHVVSDWLKQRPDLSEEEFIEEIPYGETREYVKKVYTNWQAYKRIYKN